MSTLIGVQLENEVKVTQTFSIKHKCLLHSVRLKLLRHDLLQDGILNVRIKDGSDIISSNTLDYTDFNEVTATEYCYGYFASLMNVWLGGRLTDEQEHEYTVELELTGHTDNDSVFLMWLREYDNDYIEYDVEPLNDSNVRYGIELYLGGR